MEQRPARPPLVVTAAVEEAPATRAVEYLGRVEAPRAVDVRSRVAGPIREVRFAEGSAVKAGDVLFVIDPSTYETDHAVSLAQLARAEATVEEIASRASRTRELRRGNIAPQAQLEQVQAELGSARAAVRAAEAAVQRTALDLAFTKVQAPFDGEAGRALFQLGALVGPEGGALVRVVQVDPLRVVFSLTEAELVTLRQASAAGDDPAARRLRLRLPNGTEYGPEGRIDFVDSEVSTSTGTVAVRATFPNPDRVLTPGQYVTLLSSPERPELLPVVPATAVQRDREGVRVFVLNSDDTVTERRLQLGARVAQGWSVREGLRTGERVVVQGAQRIRDGAAVRAVSANEPEVHGPTHPSSSPGRAHHADPAPGSQG